MWGGEDLAVSLGATTNNIEGAFTEPFLLARNLCLMGAAAAFLCFNFHPASVFMGDAGALFLGFIAVLPYFVGVIADSFVGGAGVLTGYQSLIISSAGLLIVVGVVLDTMKQIEAQLLMRNYEGFIR